MDVRVSGHQLDVGESLTQHVETGLAGLVEKYGVRSTGGNVTLSPGPHDAGFRCDIRIHLTQGLVLKSGAETNGTAHQAFDGAADKIETQLRRYKRRLDDHHRANGAREIAFDADYRILSGEAEVEQEVPDNPLVVAETRVDIPNASVSDAVMMLDLRHTDALMFRNSKTGAYNMVYRRDDGNIGWVEPTE